MEVREQQQRRGESGIACVSEDGGFFHCEVNHGWSVRVGMD